MRRWALLVALTSCGARARVEHRALPDFAPRGAVVARVDDRPITAEQVELFARDQHLTAREALERAIEMQVMAREAQRRGAISDDDLREFAWHARLQMLLERAVEQTVTEASLRPADVADVASQRSMELSHPASIRVVHFLAKTPEHATEAQRAEAVARAQAFRARLVAEAGERPTEAAFNTTAAAARGANDHSEAVGPFDAQGHVAGGALVPEFASGAWSLSAAAPLSQPIVTPYGAHIVLLVAERGAGESSPAEMLATVRRDMVIRQRGEAAYSLVQQLRATHQVTVNAEALSSVRTLAPEATR